MENFAMAEKQTNHDFSDLTSQQSETEQQKDQQETLGDACHQELAQLQNSYRFLLADFDNYKKRITKDNERVIFIAQSSIILKFLPILDNISRFAQSLQNFQQENNSNLVQGLSLIQKEIEKTFASLNITEVQMKTFDPEIHEAVAQIPAISPESQSGDIVDFVEKGYMFKGSLLRAAKVTVVQ